MGQRETLNNPFYAQALRDFLNQYNGCFTGKIMSKWIRKRIRFYENSQQLQPDTKGE